MSILNKLFTISDTTEEKIPDTVEKPLSKFNNGDTHSIVTPTIGTTLQNIDVADCDILKQLEASVDADTPAIYVQFKAFLNSLSSLPESIRYSTAINVASAANLNIKDVIQSLSTRIEVLNNQKTQFEAAYNAQKNELVDNKKNEIQNHEKTIQELSQQIQQLSDEIKQLNIDIGNNTTRLNNSANQFNTSFTQYLNVLTHEKTIIEQTYLNIQKT